MADQFWWCLDHNRVEGTDSTCPPDRRIGPYESREAAEHWREQYAQRNEALDEEDREWEEGPAGE
ncbi:MAG: hypothetical protein QOE35_984 [Actinomycetota bacterium]|jgi:hypothetical protein